MQPCDILIEATWCLPVDPDGRLLGDHALVIRDGRIVDRLNDLGMVNGTLVAVHAVHLDERETARCAERGVSIVHCPRSNLKLASGIADVARFLRHGLVAGRHLVENGKLLELDTEEILGRSNEWRLRIAAASG